VRQSLPAEQYSASSVHSKSRNVDEAASANWISSLVLQDATHGAPDTVMDVAKA
jgi:hypothetical protein